MTGVGVFSCLYHLHAPRRRNDEPFRIMALLVVKSVLIRNGIWSMIVPRGVFCSDGFALPWPGGVREGRAAKSMHTDIIQEPYYSDWY